jgi:AhpD family alkylhydroperoxidase
MAPPTPHITLPPLPGMMALSTYRPDVYPLIASLADHLLHTPTPHPLSTLTPSDRELIASYVSTLNNCTYCSTVHGAVSAAHSPTSSSSLTTALHECRIESYDFIGNSTPKMAALLKIAGRTTRSGRDVTPEAVGEALENGASEMDVHDVVLVAGLFCMMNRYVDGLGCGWVPEGEGREKFLGRATGLAESGYLAMGQGGGKKGGDDGRSV